MLSALSRSAAYVSLMLALGACSWLPGFKSKTADKTPAAATALVEIVNAGLLATPGGEQYELGLTLANRSPHTLWVQVHFQTPGGLGDCVISKELDSQAEHLYICAQDIVLAETDYPVLITVYSDIGQTIEVDRLSTQLNFE